MRIETQLKKRNSAISRLNDLISCATYAGMTSEALNAEARKIRETLAKCAEWTRAYFDGYHKCKIDALYRESLMFGGFFNGVFYSTHSNRPDYYETNGIPPHEFADNSKVTGRGHYWKTTQTPRPFFIDDGADKN